MAWDHKVSIEIAGTPAQVWQKFKDVPGWKEWNKGIESIELHGPFATGSTFTMKVPGQDAFVSTLTEVRENHNFNDETVVGFNRVWVYHRIAPLLNGKTRVTYTTLVTGPEPDILGPLVTADFPEVLAALKALIEKRPA